VDAKVAVNPVIVPCFALGFADQTLDFVAPAVTVVDDFGILGHDRSRFLVCPGDAGSVRWRVGRLATRQSADVNAETTGLDVPHPRFRFITIVCSDRPPQRTAGFASRANGVLGEGGFRVAHETQYMTFPPQSKVENPIFFELSSKRLESPGF
jgi:hypothetical protein